jgi:hypothetical protein
VGLAGHLLDELELAATRWQDQSYSAAQRVGRRLAGVPGKGLASLVGDLGLAANRAAAFRAGHATAFLFADGALASSLSALRRPPRIVTRVERNGVTGVLTHPGYYRRSRTVIEAENLAAVLARLTEDDPQIHANSGQPLT